MRLDDMLTLTSLRVSATLFNKSTKCLQVFTNTIPVNDPRRIKDRKASKNRSNALYDGSSYDCSPLLLIRTAPTGRRQPSRVAVLPYTQRERGGLKYAQRLQIGIGFFQATE